MRVEVYFSDQATDAAPYKNLAVESRRDDMSACEMVELWRSVLLALGYHPESIVAAFEDAVDRGSFPDGS